MKFFVVLCSISVLLYVASAQNVLLDTSNQVESCTDTDVTMCPNANALDENSTIYQAKTLPMFTVPPRDAWYVQKVRAMYSEPPTSETMVIKMYNTSAFITPDAVIFSDSIPINDSTTIDLNMTAGFIYREFTLSSGVKLNAGDYWLEAVPENSIFAGLFSSVRTCSDVKMTTALWCGSTVNESSLTCETAFESCNPNNVDFTFPASMDEFLVTNNSMLVPFGILGVRYGPCCSDSGTHCQLEIPANCSGVFVGEVPDYQCTPGLCAATHTETTDMTITETATHDTSFTEDTSNIITNTFNVVTDPVSTIDIATHSSSGKLWNFMRMFFLNL